MGYLIAVAELSPLPDPPLSTPFYCIRIVFVLNFAISASDYPRLMEFDSFATLCIHALLSVYTLALHAFGAGMVSS